MNWGWGGGPVWSSEPWLLLFQAVGLWTSHLLLGISVFSSAKRHNSADLTGYYGLTWANMCAGSAAGT